MQDSPACPACRATDWEPFAERTYRASDLPALPPARRLMVLVLFEKWLPGEEVVKLALNGCRRCGMMTYTPRPTEADIETKYRHLVITLGDATPSKREPPSRTQQRSNRIFKLVQSCLRKPVSELRVLDFGGGDGRLMKCFLEQGAKCALIDYSTNPIGGVTRIGDNESALTPGQVYDVIICSHVVEHLASPMRVLSTLHEHLAPDGIFYVEVPMEVYRELPIKTDPVTHVNFFTPASLATLLRMSGLHVETSRLTYYPHPNGGWKLAVSALATHGRQMAPRTDLAGLRELRALLDPSIMTKSKVRLIKGRDQLLFRS